MPDEKHDAPKPPSARDRLARMLRRDYDIGRSLDDRAFIASRNGPNVALTSGQAKSRLAADHLKLQGTTVGRTALDETWQAVEGIALDKEKIELPLRVAEHDDKVVVDLGDPSGRCVIVDPGGWRIENRSPVTFRRSKAMRALPEPTSGTATWDDLFTVVNVDPDHQQIYRGWLATSMIRSLPHPILNVTGPQGTAKSTMARITTRLIDPCAVESLSPPRDAESWSTLVSARWVPNIDNVSKIDPWWADELCRTATGAGTLRRQLYSDDDVVARVLRGAVIINGITMSGANRADLAERTLPLQLTRPQAYRPESDINAHVDRIAPGMLALILDDVAAILRAAGTDDVGKLRMTDFAAALSHLDAGTGTSALTAYTKMHEEHHQDTIGADPVALALQRWMDNRTTGSWTGTASALLKELKATRESLINAGDIAHDSDWPSDATRMSAALTRSETLLHYVGISVTRGARNSVARRLTITRSPQGGAAGRDADDDGRRHTNGPECHEPANRDPGDASDTESPLLAFSGKEWGGVAGNTPPGAAASQRHFRSMDIGPCAKCGGPTKRYGESGDPWCASCRASTPKEKSA
ncbi:MAG: hypothetical protein H6524_12360 [Actinobacteria bacterium]|nr:hypothetical protein [Actinomycetota bacterium]